MNCTHVRRRFHQVIDTADIRKMHDDVIKQTPCLPVHEFGHHVAVIRELLYVTSGVGKRLVALSFTDDLLGQVIILWQHA